MHSKGNHQKEPTEWEKIFSNDMTNKWLISKLYQLTQLKYQKADHPIKKWAANLNRLFWIWFSGCQQAHKKILNITNQGNANEISPYICQNGYQKINKRWQECGEKREPLYSAGEYVNWFSHYGKQYGGSPKLKELSHNTSTDFWMRIWKNMRSLIQNDTCTPYS